MPKKPRFTYNVSFSTRHLIAPNVLYDHIKQMLEMRGLDHSVLTVYRNDNEIETGSLKKSIELKELDSSYKKGK